ncbi:MAG: hypothetical protein ACC628_23820 [Pirellulaceae bacterium]
MIVERESDDYLRCLLDYVHLNPVRAGLVSPRFFIDALRLFS